MFANPKFTRKTAPVFLDSARYSTEGEALYTPAIRPGIINDEDAPPKTLVIFDTFLIPVEDITNGNKWKKTYYDLTSSICLTPEDTIKLVRYLNYLVAAIFDDHNYLRR